MTQSEKAVIDQQEKTEAGASGNDLGAPFSLWAPAKGALTHHQQAGGGTACGSRAPSGGGSAGVVLPCLVIPADANGGLCIGRSCADALGAWGHRPPTSECRVYTGALLATTISVQKQGLNIARIGAILCSCQSDKSEFGGN